MPQYIINCPRCNGAVRVWYSRPEPSNGWAGERIVDEPCDVCRYVPIEAEIEAEAQRLRE